MKCDLDLFSTGFVKRTKRYPWDGITAYSILTYLFLLFNFLLDFLIDFPFIFLFIIYYIAI